MFSAGGAVRYSRRSAESEKKAINSYLQAIIAITSQSIRSTEMAQTKNDPTSSVVCQRKCRHMTHRSTLQAPAVLQDCPENNMFPCAPQEVVSGSEIG
ncbi:hypothetical protein AVEN_25505-1 [Araneus ventricosus]|uniref:Uncharacterized protein n=1 Tax=Araneus ventricosus TaxID=182803 RepID=A0A4Y2CSB1_ARAVE|nr:hypothetical protein AVEN_25505-1 [Araneus ventricosus]